MKRYFPIRKKVLSAGVCFEKSNNNMESWEGGESAANFSVNIYMVIVYRNPKFEDNSTLCPILYPAVLSEKSIKSIQSNKLLRKLHLTDERMD